MKPDKLEKFAERAIWTIEGIMVYMICAIFLQSSDSSLETTIVTKLETIAVNNIHKKLLI